MVLTEEFVFPIAGEIDTDMLRELYYYVGSRRAILTMLGYQALAS